MINEKLEKLNTICEIIDDNDLANVIELRNSIKQNSSDNKVPSMSEVNSFLTSDAELFNLYFDAVYQERNEKTKLQKI